MIDAMYSPRGIWKQSKMLNWKRGYENSPQLMKPWWNEMNTNEQFVTATQYDGTMNMYWAEKQGAHTSRNLIWMMNDLI